MKLYGIKNCNSVKKAMQALSDRGFKFDFLDIKKIDEETLNFWLLQKDFKELINTAGITAKKLALNKTSLEKFEKDALKKLVLENPSCIKRPVIENNELVYVGKEYEALF